MGEVLNRPLTGHGPHVWPDATDLKVRQGGRIVSIAAIIAVAVNTDGRREIIGLGTGPSEAETFWTEVLRGLKARGLSGVKLVVSDAHTGLKAAIARVFDATWQGCRVQVRGYLAEGLPHRPPVWSKAGQNRWTGDPDASFFRHDVLWTDLPDGGALLIALFSETEALSERDDFMLFFADLVWRTVRDHAAATRSSMAP